MSKFFIEVLNNANAQVEATEAATASTLVLRDTTGDSGFRRGSFSGTGGGVVTTGMIKLGIAAPVASQTLDEGSTNQTLFVYDTTGGSYTHTLNAASGSAGRLQFVFKGTSDVNTVTPTRAGSDTIDGLNTLVARKQYEGWIFVCSGTATWKILGYFDGTIGTIRTLIPDPGSAGAIPVTSNGYCPLTSSGSDTRTLQPPTWAGQELLIIHAVDGGSVAITVSAAFDSSSHTVLTATALASWVRLVGTLTGSTKRWAVVATDGFTAS